MMPHRPLTDRDMAIITVLCQDREARCDARATAARAAGDRLIAPAEGKRLAESASGPTEFVLYEEGNHVCFNISYKFRPLTGDWMAEKLRD